MWEEGRCIVGDLKEIVKVERARVFQAYPREPMIGALENFANVPCVSLGQAPAPPVNSTLSI